MTSSSPPSTTSKRLVDFYWTTSSGAFTCVWNCQGASLTARAVAPCWSLPLQLSVSSCQFCSSCVRRIHTRCVPSPLKTFPPRECVRVQAVLLYEQQRWLIPQPDVYILNYAWLRSGVRVKAAAYQQPFKALQSRLRGTPGPACLPLRQLLGPVVTAPDGNWLKGRKYAGRLLSSSDLLSASARLCLRKPATVAEPSPPAATTTETGGEWTWTRGGYY